MSKKRDYTKFSAAPVEPEKVQAVVEEVVEEIVEPKVEPKLGVIVDCIKLNVRKEPTIKSDVACVLEAVSNFVVNEEESTEEFYKVVTVDGVEGYCMKRFVKLMP